MKKMILLAAITISSSAFANICRVDMVDNRTNARIASFTAYDDADGCKEGMKQCRLEIRQRNLLNRADCIRRNSGPTYPNPNPNPYPNPNPNPYPNPNPNPNPNPGYGDARRVLMNGEKVIYNNQFVTVVGRSMSNSYAVRSMDVWNTISNNVRRENLSVTNGCNGDICANERVINIRSLQYVNVVGLSYHDSFITQSNDVWNTLTSNVDRWSLAITTGCINNYYSSICVGNQVIDRHNRYATVAALQIDGKVVLKSSDVWSTLTPNVDPRNLVITR